MELNNVTPKLKYLIVYSRSSELALMDKGVVEKKKVDHNVSLKMQSDTLMSLDDFFNDPEFKTFLGNKSGLRPPCYLHIYIVEERDEKTLVLTKQHTVEMGLEEDASFIEFTGNWPPEVVRSTCLKTEPEKRFRLDELKPGCRYLRHKCYYFTYENYRVRTNSFEAVAFATDVANAKKLSYVSPVGYYTWRL